MNVYLGFYSNNILIDVAVGAGFIIAGGLLYGKAINGNLNVVLLIAAFGAYVAGSLPFEDSTFVVKALNISVFVAAVLASLVIGALNVANDAVEAVEAAELGPKASNFEAYAHVTKQQEGYYKVPKYVDCNREY